MKSSRYFVLFLLLALLVTSWFLLIVAEPGRSRLEHSIVVGFLFGTMFGQATLASAWTALGPGALLWRLPLSVLWIAALAIAMVINVATHGDPPQIGFVLIVSACLAGLWLLVQIPLWWLALGYGVRLRHRTDSLELVRERQFGIRQLLIVTTIVAVVLGVCRWGVAQTAVRLEDADWATAAFLFFIVGAGIVKSLPLLVAALLPRLAWLAVLVLLVLVGLGTWFEAPLLPLVSPKVGAGDFLYVININAFHIAWVLTVVGLVRLSGYSIAHPRYHSQVEGTVSASTTERSNAP